MDQNGTLRTSSIYDHESDDRNHTITVWATDQLGATFDKNFTIEITNVFEDMDGDGTEDFYDDDTDGDGLSNEQELANGSDPLDANSKNLAPVISIPVTFPSQKTQQSARLLASSMPPIRKEIATLLFLYFLIHQDCGWMQKITVALSIQMVM